MDQLAEYRARHQQRWLEHERQQEQKQQQQEQHGQQQQQQPLQEETKPQQQNHELQNPVELMGEQLRPSTPVGASSLPSGSASSGCISSQCTPRTRGSAGLRAASAARAARSSSGGGVLPGSAWPGHSSGETPSGGMRPRTPSATAMIPRPPSSPAKSRLGRLPLAPPSPAGPRSCGGQASQSTEFPLNHSLLCH
mmetsp:Transcript_47971/g.138871  ORF Transcript_47971/g.138871 Transcript_47971/m.138871 type:complete len:195 (+) Transcript_47971:192-776(+)